MKRIIKQFAALMVALILITGCVPMSFAETEYTDIISPDIEFAAELPETYILEAMEILPEDDGASNPSTGGEIPDIPSGEDPSAPKDDGNTVIISEMSDIGSETISGINIVRAEGYSGPIARVFGKLKLEDVMIDGIPAGETDLAEHFELVTGATVSVSSKSSLTAGFSAVSIDKGAKKTVKLKYKGKSVSGEKAKWKSSDKSVVTVGKSGTIKGISKGVATVTATYRKKSVSVRVVVTNPVTTVTMTPSVKYIVEQTQMQFSAEALPHEADYTGLVWKSSNPAIASVDENGLVSALVPGKATITASAVNGKYAAMKIQVIRPAQDMTLPETVRANLKKTKKITPTFLPEDTSLKSCTWSSSDKTIATVNSKGEVTGKKVGSCVITAVSHNGIERQCTVNVVRPVTSVKMKSSLTLSLNHTGKLKATISPSNATIKDITWTSSDPSVVSVDENGNLTALKKGTAYIRATAYNKKYARCKVTVKVYKPTSLNFSELFVTMNPGNTFASVARIKPSNASNPTVVYSSSNPAVATVDENGVVTAIGVGRATITGKCAANSKARNTFEVSVIEPGSARMAGLTIGINPGHQTKTIFKKYPLAPGSKETGYGCKVGAVGKWSRIPEYKIVLDVGKKLASMLAENGATVVITRTRNDVSISNIDRAKMLNKANVDVALQLHCNSSTNSSKYGLSAFYRTTGSWIAESKALAKALCREISVSSGLYNKGIEVYNGYMSLNYSTTPAVLLEMGYLSNKKEDKLLATEAFREKLAIGIMEGLCDYFGR